MTATPDSSWKCPVCKKPVQEGSKDFPFCGDRCRLVDLGRWLDGTYLEKLEAEKAGDEGEEETL